VALSTDVNLHSFTSSLWHPGCAKRGKFPNEGDLYRRER
jgi:hypothetical protein